VFSAESMEQFIGRGSRVSIQLGGARVEGIPVQ
jgi:hypothetical protein